MKIQKIWFTQNRIYINTDTDQELFQSLLYYPRLMQASETQRNNYTFDDEGIYWEDLDEDISLESFFYENPEPVGVSRLLLSHPEIDLKSLASKLGISFGHLKQISLGLVKPNENLEKLIEKNIFV